MTSGSSTPASCVFVPEKSPRSPPGAGAEMDGGAFSDGAMAVGAPENGAPAPAPAPAPGGDRGDFSETNTQEAGVEEPDVIKTVGDYVYRISAPVVGDEDASDRSPCERRLSVLDDSDASAGPLLVGSVPFGDLVTKPDGMLVDGDVLLVYGRTWLEYVDDADTFWGDWPAPYWWWSVSYTHLTLPTKA